MMLRIWSLAALKLVGFMATALAVAPTRGRPFEAD
jgi:hypothetical protein